MPAEVINIKNTITSVVEPIAEEFDGESTVTVLIPKTEDDFSDVPVSVNGRNWSIPRGVETEVPACVAAALKKASTD